MKQCRLSLSARKPEATHIAALLDPVMENEGLPTVLFEDEANSSLWVWSTYVAEEDVPYYRDLLKDKLGSDAFGLELQVEELPNVDWVSETLRELTPVEAGRFFVHGSHDRERITDRQTRVEIDAGLAFGTGHHGTTAGCLDMLERILQLRRPRHALDLGTGSGVLAIALAKSQRIPVLGTDIDPVAVRVAKENSQLNGTATYTTMVTAAGFQHPAFKQQGPFDLVLANILARPLEQLSAALAKHVTKGGDIILSGLLPHQQARIVNAYRRQGLVLKRASIRDGWLTLWLQKP